MKILRFEIRNEKAIASWIHDANGNHVAIAGDTGSGKTTAASALWDIASSSKDCLRHGESKGSITLHLGDDKPDLIATRTFTAKTNTVVIRKADNSRISVKDFKDMISSLSENPHRIKDMKPKERVATLLKAADLGDVSLDNMDERIRLAEEARLIAFRKAEDSKPGPMPAIVEAIDVSAVNAELEKARIVNDAIAADQTEIDALILRGKQKSESIAEQDERIDDLVRELEQARGRLSILTQNKKDMQDEYIQRKAAHDAMKPVDTTDMQAKLASATQVNDKAAEYTQWKRRNEENTAAKKAHEQVDCDVKKLQAEKKAVLDNAKWPLPGLSVCDGDVIYNGSLFDNLGESEQMLVCAALAINDIKAHPLHCVRMDGAESLSKADFAKLQALFGDEGIQVISTRVCEDTLRNGEITITEREDDETQSVG